MPKFNFVGKTGQVRSPNYRATINMSTKAARVWLANIRWSVSEHNKANPEKRQRVEVVTSSGDHKDVYVYDRL